MTRSRHLLGAGLLAVAACARAASPPSPDLPLEAELVGYAALRATEGGLEAHFDAGALPVLALAPGAPELEVHLSFEREGLRVPLPFRRRVVAEGRVLLEVEAPVPAPPPGPAALTVRRGSRALRFPAVWRAPPAEALRAAGLPDTSPRARLAWLEAELERLPSELIPPACIEVARIHRSDGRLDAAEAAYRRCAELARARGWPTEASRGLRAAAFLAFEGGRLAEAEALLDQARALEEATGDALGAARNLYCRGLVERALGDFRGARRSWEGAARLAAGAGRDAEAVRARMHLAVLLQDVGRHREALAELEGLRPAVDRDDLDPELRAGLANNLGWVTARAMAKGAVAPRWPEAEALLTAAVEANRAAHLPAGVFGATANLAWVAWLRGDVEAAKVRMREALALPAPSEGIDRLFIQLVDAELAAAGGDLRRARRSLAEVEEAGRAHGSILGLDYAARASFGRARLEARAGRRDRAIELALEAQRLIERVGRDAAIRGERAPFFGDRRDAAELALALLLDAGRTAEAFALADRIHGRVLRSLAADVRQSRLSEEARRRWARGVESYREARARFEASRGDGEFLSQRELRAWEAERSRTAHALEEQLDELFALLEAESGGGLGDGAALAAVAERLAPSEALVSFVEVSGTWRYLLLGGGAVRHGPAERVAEASWGLDRRLRHLYVVPGGWPDALGLPGARHAGELLLARFTVSFLPFAGLLLLEPGAPSDTSPLVVADPRLDLPEARREGREVAGRAAGARTLTGAEATRERVLAGLQGASLFHFAGHGATRPESPWASRLLLAAGDELTLDDLLVLRPRASLVVLSGCETGRPPEAEGLDAVGLPEAFLLAGARAVLATDRVVEDAAARRFIEAYYAAGGAERAAEAFRRAALAREAEGDGAWRAFRIVGRGDE